MARVSGEKLETLSDMCTPYIKDDGREAESVVREIIQDLQDARSVLRDLLIRMEDHYDGAPDAKPSLPFNGNDMEEIKQVLG